MSVGAGRRGPLDILRQAQDGVTFALDCGFECGEETAGVGAVDGAVVDGAGDERAAVADGEAEGWGDCASAAPPDAKTTIGTSATMAERKVLIRFIFNYSPSIPSRRSTSRCALLSLTRKVGFRPLTDASCTPAD